MKLLIIEDRIPRLQQFAGFDLENCTEVEILKDVSYDTLLSELEEGKVHSLEKFACIAAHRSALSVKTTDTLKTYCNKSKKPLILFSGGISTSMFKDDGFPFLNINSKDFYSINLKYFLEELRLNRRPNILIIQFGLKWKINLLLKLRNDLVVQLNLGKTIRIKDLKIGLSLSEELTDGNLIKLLNKSDYAAVSEEELKEFRLTIDRIINDIA